MNTLCFANLKKKDLNDIVCKLSEIVIKNNFDEYEVKLNSFKGINHIIFCFES